MMPVFVESDLSSFLPVLLIQVLEALYEINTKFNISSLPLFYAENIKKSDRGYFKPDFRPNFAITKITMEIMRKSITTPTSLLFQNSSHFLSVW
ncbi:protein of unknown function [Candidatus Nitrosotalea okcheonensis]|uniref:Uncharacterized protein n=1 Tax=Candidatus Nitrosotalea okcheonensis TaxID=1903276 RepID=A0A2H1FE12_9ARCH|nr:protein of unknown function [Candidatus Nitrosotalea okcheonensis]